MALNIRNNAAEKPSTPLTLERAISSPDWLSSPYWPVSQETLRSQCIGPLRQITFLANRVEKDLQPIMNLITPAVASWGAALIEAALMAPYGTSDQGGVIQQSLFDENKKLELISGTQPKQNRNMTEFEVKIRNIFRTGSWSRFGNIYPNFMSPQIIALTHNPLLIETASKNRGGIFFHHGDVYLNRLLPSSENKIGERAERVAELLANCLSEKAELSEDLGIRYHSLCFEIILNFAMRAERDLTALQNVELPEHVWMGTFAKWSSRAIGLAVMSRGGKVTVFDHGGGVGNVDDQDHFQQEICAGASFVASSPMAADMIRSNFSGLSISPERIIAGSGDPSFRKVSRSTPRNRAMKKNVLYATTIFRGHRQFSPALLPDPVYLIWQEKVLCALKRMPVETLFKPAPEGLLVHKPHPLAKVFETSYKAFEMHLERSDIFVFDYAHTTTFWKALCSNSTVILFDLGVNALSPVMRKMLNERAKIIIVEFGSDGIPILNEEQFIDAISAAKTEDPTFFRELVCAEKGVDPWPSW